MFSLNKPTWRRMVAVISATGIPAALIIGVVLAADFHLAGNLVPAAAPASTMHSLLEMTSKNSSDTFDRTTDSLEAIRDKVDVLAMASAAPSNADWTSGRAVALDYLNSDLRYLAANPLGTPASGSVAGLIGEILTDTSDSQPKIGEISDYSASYPAGTSVFSALKDIRDKLAGY